MSAYSLSVVQCAMKKVNPLEIVVIFLHDWTADTLDVCRQGKYSSSLVTFIHYSERVFKE